MAAAEAAAMFTCCSGNARRNEGSDRLQPEPVATPPAPAPAPAATESARAGKNKEPSTGKAHSKKASGRDARRKRQQRRGWQEQQGPPSDAELAARVAKGVVRRALRTHTLAAAGRAGCARPDGSAALSPEADAAAFRGWDGPFPVMSIRCTPSQVSQHFNRDRVRVLCRLTVTACPLKVGCRPSSAGRRCSSRASLSCSAGRPPRSVRSGSGALTAGRR